MAALHSKTILADLWRATGQPGDALGAVDLSGTDPLLPSSFAVGTLAQTTIAAAALAAGELWHLRTGRRQRVAVAMRDAEIEFRSERYLQVNGKPAPEYMDPIHGIYRCRGGRWVRIHANFPHHRNGVVRLLGCDHNPAAVAHALAQWEAAAFEAAAAEAGLVATMSRSFAEWDAYPQGRAVAGLPLFSIERIGDAPPRPLPAGDRPLSGIRVLDLTRVIAGPVCGRTLAAHGADVLWVTARHLPKMEPLVIDNGRGKLSTAIDLRDADGRAALTRLLGEADVFVQGYRPGAIAAHSFGPQDAARMRPGIVYVSLCAYGHAGPWAGRRGFNSLVQNVNGLNVAEAEAAGYRPWHRLSDGVSRDDGARPSCAGRRELARARLACPDRTLAALIRTRRRPVPPRSWFRRRA